VQNGNSGKQRVAACRDFQTEDVLALAVLADFGSALLHRGSGRPAPCYYVSRVGGKRVGTGSTAKRVDRHSVFGNGDCIWWQPTVHMVNYEQQSPPPA